MQIYFAMLKGKIHLKENLSRLFAFFFMDIHQNDCIKSEKAWEDECPFGAVIFLQEARNMFRLLTHNFLRMCKQTAIFKMLRLCSSIGWRQHLKAVFALILTKRNEQRSKEIDATREDGYNSILLNTKNANCVGCESRRFLQNTNLGIKYLNFFFR